MSVNLEAAKWEEAKKTYEDNNIQKAWDMLENQQSKRNNNTGINRKKDIFQIQLTLNWL